MESLRVLVTGCSGVLGPQVVQQLERDGHEVLGLDLVEPPSPINQFVRGDFTSKADSLEALRRIDTVCHLGGIGDVYLALKDPALAFRVNAFGTGVLCNACVESDIYRLVYASTWEVYGSPRHNPVDETHECVPHNSYSISKLAGELLVRGTNRPGRMQTVSLRLGTAYGPRMRETAVMSRFLRRALEGNAVTVLGDGSQIRQFTHAIDIGRAFSLAVSNEKPGEVYNIVAAEQVSILELAHQIAERYGVGIEFQGVRADEPPSAYLTSDRARRDLNWQQTIEFVSGLKQTMAHFESQKKA